MIEVLNPKEAADYLSVSQDRLQHWRTHGGGPPFIKWGPKTIRYRLCDLNRWLDEQPLHLNTAS